MDELDAMIRQADLIILRNSVTLSRYNKEVAQRQYELLTYEKKHGEPLL